MKYLMFLILLFFTIFPKPILGSGSLQKIVFEERMIEGKIRRPQLVLIKADQRPKFKPMVMQGLGKDLNSLEFINDDIIEEGPYKKQFSFIGRRISNYVK